VRIILGIGNPGRRYGFNRHNVGFMLLDYIAAKESLSFHPSKGDYYCAVGKIGNSQFSLIKPSTYVNESGRAALQALQLNKVDIEDFLVVADDLNLKFGDLKVNASGGDSGHNGLSSIIYHLNSNQFPRFRIGTGSSFEKGKMAEYVLTDFNKEEIESLKNTFSIGLTLVKEFVSGGIKQMLDANSRLPSENSNLN
jgi:peptidyl-tRNA hydrolase, PTH1 family